MSIYQFSDNSPVREMTFRYANDRPPIGLLTAADGADAHALSTIRRGMESQGWNCVPASIEGRDVLQVDGFEKTEQLSGFLQSYHFVYGEPKVTAEPGDNPTRTAGEWLKGSSLKAAGWLNLIGDVALLGSGIMKAQKGEKDARHEITAGALYTAGAGVLARYGNVKTEHHVREVLERTGEFMKQQAITLPEDCGLFSIMRDKRQGLIPNAESFLSRYPSEVMLSAYTLGAFEMLRGAMKRGNTAGIGYGVSSLTFKAASLAIPEKKKTDAEHPAAHSNSPIGQVMNWVQEKPLRVFGFGSMITDALLGFSALHEYRNNPKQRSYIFKFITTGTYLMADVMMAISNKDHTNAGGQFDVEEQRRIEAMAAETIARQPEAVRAGLANQVAGFLATQPEMKGKAPDISKAIMEQVQHMHDNPWACRTSTEAPFQPNR